MTTLDATIAPPPPTPRPGPTTGGSRMLLPNISWPVYTGLLADLGGGARLTYDHGWLEIEMPGWLHELIARFVGELVTSTLKRLRIAYTPGGATTWRREAGSRGLEGDECYYVQSLSQIIGKVDVDLAVDPPPDLAVEVEVEVESPLLDKVAVYAGLGVPELWRVRADGACDMLRLDADGAYRPVAASLAVPPLTPAVVSQYVRLMTGLDFPTALARFEAEFLPTVAVARSPVP